MNKLIADGYTHLVIQPTNIIEGIEMEALRKEVKLYQKKFKDIRLGNALLYSPEDYQATVKAIAEVSKERKKGIASSCATEPTTRQTQPTECSTSDESPRT